MTINFVSALESKSLELLRTIEKSDLHNHGVLGGNLSYFETLYKKRIPRLDHKLQNIEAMDAWVQEHFLPMVQGAAGFECAIEAAFTQATQDGVRVLSMSIDVYFRFLYDGKVAKLVSKLAEIHKRVAPEMKFLPQLGLTRSVDSDTLYQWFEPFLDSDYFVSLDLYGNEFGQEIGNLKRIYRAAEDKGLILKAHVGEFGDAYSIREAIETLHLNQIQHGIAAHSCGEIAQWLADNKIQLNICPTSNIVLNRVPDYKNHPIRKLFDYGVPVTINTDDVIVFNKSVSEEYLTLFQEGVFTAKELDFIRVTGLNSETTERRTIIRNRCSSSSGKGI